MIARVRLGRRHLTRKVTPGPPREPPKPAQPPSPGWRRWMLPIALAITAFLIVISHTSSTTGPTFAYTDFAGRVQAGQVQSVTINDQGAVKGALKAGTRFTTRIPTALDNSAITQQLESQKVQVTAERSGGGSVLGSLLLIFLPLVLVAAFFLWSGRMAARSLSGGLSAIGRSRAKIIEAERPTTRFVDVAGYEGVKQEISEIVDFLRTPGVLPGTPARRRHPGLCRHPGQEGARYSPPPGSAAASVSADAGPRAGTEGGRRTVPSQVGVASKALRPARWSGRPRARTLPAFPGVHGHDDAVRDPAYGPGCGRLSAVIGYADPSSGCAQPQPGSSGIGAHTGQVRPVLHRAHVRCSSATSFLKPARPTRRYVRYRKRIRPSEVVRAELHEHPVVPG